MKIIDLKKYSNTHAQNQIAAFWESQISEGNRSSHKSKLITGLQYSDPGYGIQSPTHRVVISVYPKGLGIYFTNIENNRLILIPNDHIQSVIVEKATDKFKPLKFSIFSMLTKLGMPFNNAKHFLSPVEIIEKSPGTCTIFTKDHIFKFEINKNSPEKVSQELKKSNLEYALKVSIAAPEII